MGLFRRTPPPRRDWSENVRENERLLAGYQRQLREYTRRTGGGADDYTTSGLKANIEGCRRAIRLFRS